jgi:hypothetical protein
VTVTANPIEERRRIRPYSRPWFVMAFTARASPSGPHALSKRLNPTNPRVITTSGTGAPASRTKIPAPTADTARARRRPRITSATWPQSGTVSEKAADEAAVTSRSARATRHDRRGSRQ